VSAEHEAARNAVSDESQGRLFADQPGPSNTGKKLPRAPKAPPRKRTPRGKVRREFSAGFILFRDTPGGPVFLLLDYGKHWDYAKGHLEEGETAWQAAVRELREETGIRQVDRVTRFERDMHYFFFSPKKGQVHKTVTYFLGRTRVEEVALSDEHSGYAWLGYDEAMGRLTYENAREMLRAAHEALQNK
jgi:8-oxo-dGTP pyrophosphatase MutT (NUDIX family)